MLKKPAEKTQLSLYWGKDAFSIVEGNLVLGKHFSVGTVEGAGADARITRYRQAYPGVHVDGIERWLYPIPVPGS